ncbi:MAG: thiamine phosphate synthase [Dehalococcoidia bacterium]|nr:thiamine phosphate synthase [Dehalococcoidia bacterium]
MLADEERVREVARLLEDAPATQPRRRSGHDSESGFPLLEPAAMDALRTLILRLASVVTPNVHETAHLSGLEVHGPREAEEAGRRILDLGARAVLVKGGHFEEQRATDVLVERDAATHFPGEYIDSRNTHGTGCTYSAAIATHLGAGRSLHEAIRLVAALHHRGHPARSRSRWRGRPHRPLLLSPAGRRPLAAVRRRNRRRLCMKSATIPRLHVITDETVQDRFSHTELAQRAVEGGADAVQFREKRPWTTRELMETATVMLRVCEPAGATLVVDDRADVARSVGAPALHLGKNDLDVATARAILGPDAIIGGTANSYDEAARVWSTGVDYMGIGPIYGTQSKANPAPVMGLETLSRICRDCPVPVVAIGSITADRIPEVLEAGAHGVAVLSAVVAAEDPAEATRRCRDAIDRALHGVSA